MIHKTNKDFRLFGIFIPKGTVVIESQDSCALLAQYDETKGCTFDKKSIYTKPTTGLRLVALDRSYVDDLE
jgi:hypothetical protein